VTVPRAWRRLLVSLVAAGVAIAVAGMVAGPIGYAAAAALSLLVVAWRHDNAAGTCLPLAMLVLITIGVMLFLFRLLIVIHPR
jgi:hypothetical protein